MTEESAQPHYTFWVVGVLALIWFGMGTANFLYQMAPGSLENYSATEQTIITNRPIWATLGFAVSVLGGLAGAMALLRRNPICDPLFLISLLGTMVATSHTLLLGLNPGLMEMIMTVALPIGLGIFLVWYAAQAKSRTWLK